MFNTSNLKWRYLSIFLQSFEDMVNMVVLDEVSILNNLRDRFKQNQIYVCISFMMTHHLIFIYVIITAANSLARSP